MLVSLGGTQTLAEASVIEFCYASSFDFRKISGRHLMSPTL